MPSVNTRTVIRAINALHRQGAWPTVRQIADHLRVPADTVKPLLDQLQRERLYKGRRRHGDVVWGPWDDAGFAR